MDTVIFTGRQTREELAEKHPVEYERLLAEGRLEEIRGDEPQRWFVVAGKVVGFAAIATGFILLLLTLFSFRL